MPKFIGHDCTVFALQAAGQDTNPQSGGVASLLGQWESIEVTVTNEWSNVTSSDATQPEKRWKLATFTASLKTWIDNKGSEQLLLFGSAQLAIVTFTEKNSGKTMVLRGGISKAGAVWNADNGKDSLDIEDVGSGNFGGAFVFAYS